MLLWPHRHRRAPNDPALNSEHGQKTPASNASTERPAASHINPRRTDLSHAPDGRTALNSRAASAPSRTIFRRAATSAAMTRLARRVAATFRARKPAGSSSSEDEPSLSDDGAGIRAPYWQTYFGSLKRLSQHQIHARLSEVLTNGPYQYSRYGNTVYWARQDS